MKVIFEGRRINLLAHGVGGPRLEGQKLRIEHQLTVLLNILISNDWLHSGVRVVDQQLVDRFEGDFRVGISFAAVQPQYRVVLLRCRLGGLSRSLLELGLVRVNLNRFQHGGFGLGPFLIIVPARFALRLEH